MMNKIWLLALFLLLVFKIGESQSSIKTLPGYSGTLPFKLETGYIGVGENDEEQLFYYFVESESNPRKDPLLIWFTGGPGCSGLSTLASGIGPLTFDFANFNGSLPSILLKPYSWTKYANIIFVDWPAGTGFSYSTTSQGYFSSDTKSAKDNYTFLRKWLLNHPMFIKNHLYVAGDSYGGKLAPMVALEILRGNEAGLQPRMSLQGYIIGNAVTDENIEKNAIILYAQRMALISREYFEAAKIHCDREYDNRDPTNLQCLLALQPILKCINPINEFHILEPKCANSYISGGHHTFREDFSIDHLLLPSEKGGMWCISQIDGTSFVWANDPTVQEALHIRKGTILRWMRCNHSLSYEVNVQSVVQYHKLLSKKGYKALVYSGDHDMKVPYTNTLKWIRSLNMTVQDNWRPWVVNGQVAGYTEKYKNNDFYLTFVTVKGAGHIAPEYKPRECKVMLDRWLSPYPL